jgi:hypothetical protein
MKITKYGNLTADELMAHALLSFTDNDELGLELLTRYMDLINEKEMNELHQEDEVTYWAGLAEKLRAEVKELKRDA